MGNMELVMLGGRQRDQTCFTQSSRAARGLGLTTRLTAALDVGLGAARMGTAGWGVLMSGASAANGATSIARLSQGARLVNFASKAAPVFGPSHRCPGSGPGRF